MYEDAVRLSIYLSYGLRGLGVLAGMVIVVLGYRLLRHAALRGHTLDAEGAWGDEWRLAFKRAPVGTVLAVAGALTVLASVAKGGMALTRDSLDIGHMIVDSVAGDTTSQPWQLALLDTASYAELGAPMGLSVVYLSDSAWAAWIPPGDNLERNRFQHWTLLPNEMVMSPVGDTLPISIILREPWFERGWQRLMTSGGALIVGSNLYEATN